MVDGDRRFTYGELAGRCAAARRRAASSSGVAPGDRVAVLAPNTSLPLEAHFGVPMAGAVLSALNHRLSADELGYIVEPRRGAAAPGRRAAGRPSAGAGGAGRRQGPRRRGRRCAGRVRGLDRLGAAGLPARATTSGRCSA